MLFNSRFPEMHLWPEIERYHLEKNLCPEAALSYHLFRGARAAALTRAAERFTIMS